MLQEKEKTLRTMSLRVSPTPDKRVPKLTLPTTTYKLMITEIVKKSGANGNFPGHNVLTIGLDSAMMITVEGTTMSEVYLTEDEKTVRKSSGSFCGSTFAKVGNNAVEIGIVKNVNRTVK